MRLRTEKGTKVANNLLHISSYRASNIIQTKRWSVVGWTMCTTLPSVFVLFWLHHAYVEKIPGSPRDTNSRSGRAWERGYKYAPSTRPSSRQSLVRYSLACNIDDCFSCLWTAECSHTEFSWWCNICHLLLDSSPSTSEYSRVQCTTRPHHILVCAVTIMSFVRHCAAKNIGKNISIVWQS